MRAQWSTAATALVLLGLMLGGCGGSSSGATATHASYQTLVDAGIHLLKTGNPGAAQQLFQQAIAKDPHSPIAYYDLGVVYEQRGDDRDAMRNYSHAIAQDRNYVPALYNQAELLTKSNQPLAIFYYQRIIRLKPNSPTAYLHLGLLETARKPTFQIGLRYLSKAVKLDPALRADIPAPLRARLDAAKSR